MMMISKILITAAISMTMLACSNPENNAAKTDMEQVPNQPQQPGSPEPPLQPEAPLPPPVKEFKSKTGKVFLFEESHPRGMSLSDISVRFADDKNSEFTASDIDPVSKVLLADLDNNGFDELYIFTTAAGSGSYGKVHGYASLKDKSLGMVNMPEPSEKDMVKGGNFEGYEGHDEFDILNNELTRFFPVKSDKGTKRTITYKMVPGEAMYQLVIKSSKLN
jgi:hypothetical protein